MLLRFLPEMNGNWFQYGQQPTNFIALWKRVHAKLKRDAPKTALVWAPSSGNGYPYSPPLVRSDSDANTVHGPDASIVSDDNFHALDTNHDGIVNAEDDPYAPYYPGDEFVDWVGLSVYHYAGETYPWDYNSIPSSGKFENLLNVRDFYSTYGVAYNKSFMVPESGASYHPYSPDGLLPAELDIKQAWWRQYITNPAFLDAHPQIKLIGMFEFAKFEETDRLGNPDWRDFRITTKDDIRNAFLRDFAAVQHYYVQPNIYYSHGGANEAAKGGVDGTAVNPNAAFGSVSGAFLAGLASVGALLLV